MALVVWQSVPNPEHSRENYDNILEEIKGRYKPEDYSANTSTSSWNTIEYQISKTFQNSLGFIKYGHYGQLPCNHSDIELGSILPIDLIHISISATAVRYNENGEGYSNGYFTSVTNILGIDCETVEVRRYENLYPALGRVAIVNEYGYCIYDTFTKPKEIVTDYGTEYSGIRAEDLVNAPTVDTVIRKVAEMVKGKVLIGHSIYHDLKVLRLLGHPESQIRDTAHYFKYKDNLGYSPSLRQLVRDNCNATIQEGEHNPIEDAQSALRLYLTEREEWENLLQNLKKLLTCGHWPDLTQIKMENLKSIKCMKNVKKVLPCGHEQMEPCHKQDGFIFNNMTKVNILLACGHTKEELRCGDEVTKCRQKIKLQLPCGHTRKNKILCHKKATHLLNNPTCTSCKRASKKSKVDQKTNTDAEIEVHVKTGVQCNA